MGGGTCSRDVAAEGEGIVSGGFYRTAAIVITLEALFVVWWVTR